MTIAAPYPLRFRGWTPEQITRGGLAAWWDFSDHATVFSDTTMTTAVNAGGTIAAVRDKAGGTHLTQATSSLRPTWEAPQSNLLNGLHGAAFDGTDDYFDTVASGLSFFRTVSAYSVFCHFRKRGGAGNRRIVGFTNGPSGFTTARYQILEASGGQFETGGRRLDTDSYQNIVGTTIASDLTNWTVAGVVDLSSQRISLFVNGSRDAASTFQTPGLSSDTDSQFARVGNLGTTSGSYFNGWMFEIVLLRSSNESYVPLMHDYFVRNRVSRGR